MALPSHWEAEDVIITFEEEGADTVFNVEGKMTNISFGGGAENTEEIFMFGGKTINFQKPREKFEVSFDLIIEGTDFDFVHFGDYESGNIGSLNGKEIRSSTNPSRWRIVVWFQEAANHISNSGNTITVPAKTGNLLRWIFTDCKSVKLEKEFAADNVLKGSLSFELSSSDENGYANVFKEYTTNQSGTALTTLTATAHKGVLTWATTTPAWTGSYRT